MSDEENITPMRRWRCRTCGMTIAMSDRQVPEDSTYSVTFLAPPVCGQCHVAMKTDLR